MIGGTDITKPGVSLVEIRKRVGLVFQYPEYQLFEETVEKDVAYGPGNLGLSPEEIDERVHEALTLVGLDYETVKDRSPFELSGGQKRAVAIAGVIAMRPQVLILDEPTAGLDPRTHGDILKMIRTIHQKTGNIIILVSHNMGDIAILADRVLVMDRGKLAMEGTPEEVVKRYQDAVISLTGQSGAVPTGPEVLYGICVGSTEPKCTGPLAKTVLVPSGYS